MSSFSGDTGREEEDGGGWDGLMPSPEEREEEIRSFNRAVLPVGGSPAEVRALRAELVECRERTLRDAARAVCGYCSGHFPSFARKAIGPNAAGNYTHTRNDVSDVVLCVASSIYSLIAYEAAVSARAAKEEKP